MVAEDAGKKAQKHGVKTLEVEVRGPGSGRESALRALAATGFNITSVRDVTGVARWGPTTTNALGHGAKKIAH